MKVKELTTKNYYSFDQETPFFEVVKEFEEHHLTYGIIKNFLNKVVGIVTVSDLYNASFPSYNEIHYHQELMHDTASIYERNKSIYDQPIKYTMTKNPECVDANHSIIEATLMMKVYKVKQLPVYEKDKFIGMLTIHDLLKKFILHKIKSKKIKIKHNREVDHVY